MSSDKFKCVRVYSQLCVMSSSGDKAGKLTRADGWRKCDSGALEFDYAAIIAMSYVSDLKFANTWLA